MEFHFVSVRHNNRAHVSAITNIDHQVSENPRSLTDTQRVLSTPYHYGVIIGLPTDDGGCVAIGFAICEFYSRFDEPKRIVIHDLMVRPEYRRIGAGTALFKAVAERLDDEFAEMTMLVHEKNDVGLVFLRALNRSICDGAFGKFELVRRDEGPDVVRFRFSPAMAPA